DGAQRHERGQLRDKVLASLHADEAHRLVLLLPRGRLLLDGALFTGRSRMRRCFVLVDGPDVPDPGVVLFRLEPHFTRRPLEADAPDRTGAAARDLDRARDGGALGLALFGPPARCQERGQSQHGTVENQWFHALPPERRERRLSPMPAASTRTGAPKIVA